MAKSPRSGENRGRRAADRHRVAEGQAPAPEPGRAAESQATVPSQATARDLSALSAARRSGVTDEQIARRAYEIFLSRGGTHGYHIEDWLQAERELRAK